MVALERILTINPGSSSLRVAVFRIDRRLEQMELAVEAGGIGIDSGYLAIRGKGGDSRDKHPAVIADHADALRQIFGELVQRGFDRGIVGIGQRIVHGYTRYSAPAVIDAAMVDYLGTITRLDPMHLPDALAAIDAVLKTFPKTPQVACFDTAFHKDLPLEAREYPLPATFAARGVQRYGFHGLSYESVMGTLAALGESAAAGRVVIAHLGNGASMAAVRDGIGIDTTMGLTPAGGLMMGTRVGDLDPGVLLVLASEGMSATALSELVNGQSGLLGVSGVSHDMMELHAAAKSDARAAQAIAMFCYSARKFVGAMMAALGGLDTLVFTGGIGEHDAEVRAAICEPFAFVGLALDPEQNASHAAVISSPKSSVTVRVIATNEELVMARHTRACLEARGYLHVSI